jgi:hypothetical protein
MATAAAIKFGGKAAPVDPTRVPAGVDVSTFFNPSIADEVKAAVPVFHALSADIIRAGLELIRKYFINGSISDEEFIEMQNKTKQSGSNFGVMLTGLYSIIRMAVYAKTPLTKINTDLKAMNVPPAVADDITRVVNALRATIERNAISSVRRAPGFTHLSKLRWRIDVSISSGSLSRVMRPSILMQLYLTNGSVKTFEISVEQFNQLRYSVAKVSLPIYVGSVHL